MKLIPIVEGTLSTFVDGSGDPVLFVHGFPLDHTMWIEQLAAFAWSHQVIAPDLRGFGRSTITSGCVSMEEMADDCVRVLDALDVTRPITLVGLSMGGYVAWQFARKYPERMAKLVVCDTRSFADSPEGRETRLKMAAHVIEHGPAAVAEAMPAKIFAPAMFQEQPQVVAATKAVIAGTHPQGIAAAQLGMAARPDMTSFLATIRVPTLVVCGEHDAISPPDEMRAIAAKIPQAEFALIAEAGHMAPLERPGEFNRALRRFLAG